MIWYFSGTGRIAVKRKKVRDDRYLPGYNSLHFSVRRGCFGVMKSVSLLI